MASKRFGVAGYLTTMAATAALLPVASAFAADAGAPEQTKSSTVEEVMVTAQRREERLKDVPISVTAVSPQTLANAAITDSHDLPLVTPGLRFNNGGLSVQPEIRGITTTNTFVTSDPNIATYLDGVYQSTMFAGIYELPDVQQVQVLKGPQGTLFGRNATGGAILINTYDPSLTHLTGHVEAGYGSLNEARGEFYVSMPVVSDKLAVSLTGMIDHSDGWRKNILVGVLPGQKQDSKIDNYLIRGKIRFEPMDGVDFILTGYYTKRVDYNAFKDSNYHGNNIAVGPPFFLPPNELASRPNVYSSDVDGFYNGDDKGGSLRGKIRLGPGTLTTTTAYDQVNSFIDVDGDASPLVLSVVSFPSFDRTVTQEIVYTTDQLGRFHGTIGGFYYQNSGGSILNVNHSFLTIYTIDRSTAYAGFGDFTYDITDKLSLTAGVRYSYERKTANADITFGPVPQPASYPFLGAKSWSSVTPRASLLYKVDDRTNVYFTFSQGFKSGAFNTVAFQATPVNPEHIDSYEGGVKSNPTDNLNVSAAVFYYNYTGLQIPAITQMNGSFSQILLNAASAEIYGAELNATWKVTPEFTLTFGGSYLHARYTSFPNAAILLPNPGGAGNFVPVCPPLPSAKCDASGNTMLGSPTWTNDLTANYTKDTNLGIFSASATVYFSTKVFWDVGDRIAQPDFATVNIDLTWRPHDSGWQVEFWGKNITNQKLIYSTVLSTTADGVDYAPPATFGGRVKYSF